MNYGELKTAVLEEAHRPDLTAKVAGFIRLAEGRMARELRTAEQAASSTLAEADRVSEGIYTLPPTCLEIRTVFLLTDTRPQALEQVGLAQIRARASSSPVAQFAVRGEQVEFRGVPATDSEFEVEHLARFASLSADTDTNDLLERHEALYLFGAVFHLFMHTQDLELAQAAGELFTDAVERINEQAGRKLGGAGIAGAYNLYGGGGGY